MPKQTKYTKDAVAPIVAQSRSMAEVIKAFGLKPTGGNYTHIRSIIKKFSLDTSHFSGQGWNKGGTTTAKISLTEYLANNKPISSARLRQKLIKEGLKEDRCEVCGIKEWRGEKIRFELHHKNHNHFDNSLNNLEILCPNCHSQQE